MTPTEHDAKIAAITNTIDGAGHLSYLLEQYYISQFCTLKVVHDRYAEQPSIEWDHWSEQDEQAWRDGDVWGYVIESPSGEHIDSCWGFYGSDIDNNGMLDHIPAGLHDAARAAMDTPEYN